MPAVDEEAPVNLALDARELTRLGYRSQQHAQRHFDRWCKRREKMRPRCTDDDILSDIHSQLMVSVGISVREQELSDAVQSYLSLVLADAQRLGEQTVSRDEILEHLSVIAEEHGYPYGLPLPEFTEKNSMHPLVLARGVPMRGIFEVNQGFTEMQQELTQRKIKVRNSWTTLGDQTVCVVDTTEGPMAWPRPHAGERLRKFMETTLTRAASAASAEAEMKAMESLKKRLGVGPWASYVLNGAFGEASERSGIHYIFRKGLPVLAVSFRTPNQGGRVLAALCLHPMGYFRGTFAGVMTPTDEVIAQLLMMRANEHKFWAKSGQWPVTDSRSGV
jgi:hypothetical protein